MAKLSIPVTDYANKGSTVKVPVPDAIADLDITSVFNAVDGMTIGNLGQSVLETATPKDAGPGGAPANQDAQREYKWLCYFSDNVTGKEYMLEVPCSDLALLAAGTEAMNLADAGAGQEFKTQFDAFVIAPLTGNAVTLNKVESIGRNL